MTAPSRVSYRHFLYLTATRPLLLASQSLTPRHDYMAQVVQTDAPAPVDVSYQDESSTYNGRGPLDAGDLVVALGNFLPYRYQAANRRWEFLWQDHAKPTGFSDPATYNKMMMWSPTQQCYEMAAPTLTRLQLDLRRRGESLLTTEWLARELETITRPATPPVPDPAVRQKIVRNHQWGVRYSGDAFNWSPLDGVIRTTLNIPQFREAVFSMRGAGVSWDEISQRQIAPMLSVYMLVNSDWVDHLFGQANELYLEVGGGSDFNLRCRGKKSAQDPFTLDGSRMIVKADFTLTGSYAPDEPATFSTTVTAAPAPTTTRFGVAAGTGSLFEAGDTIAIGGDESVVTAIATDRLTISPALSTAPSTGDVVTRLPAWPRHRYASFALANTPHSSLT